MKTAKEYIAEIKINDANIDYIRNHPERKINGNLLQDIEKAMQEYSQQEAIEFAKWVETNFEEVKPPNELPAEYMARRIEVYGDDTYIIEELYKIWKDENNS